ncbi:MAG: tRNA (N6-threonylcarbamoyladenosine(37)-N6)-methyltransferase TrmO [Oscillospiraceae bacterium]|nr:tRNA (N6-threonylcarbamoyladenosine(37)-N6)-methyltransferase TrmO [Oscillospiraceae bacterium]
MNMEIRPIAYIRTDFPEKFGIPRQSGRVPSLVGKIVFLPEYRNSDAIRGIEGFSHLWLIFDFSESHRSEWSPTVRPPRLGGNKRIGVFASRSPFRPNPLGLSSVKLVRTEMTEHEGCVLIVSGADLLDMTPIYDIKPYLPFADCHAGASGGYAEEFEEYCLDVIFENGLEKKLPQEKLEAVTACLAEDPRPSYQNDEERVYSMRFAEFDIHFRVSGKTLSVIGIDCI